MARTPDFTVPFRTRNHFQERFGKPREETTKATETRPETILCGRHKTGRLLGPTETTSNGRLHGNNSCPSRIPKVQEKVTGKKNTLLLEISCEPIEECIAEQSGWCTRGSSPLLGCLGNDYNSISSKMNSQAQPSGSSSALDTYYDSSSSPLSISQQTSASSALYMALRKGFPPIKSPLYDDKAWSGKSSNKKVSGPLSENRRGGKQRPPHLDLSTFFPKPQTSSEPLCSPQRVISSPSAMSLASGSIQSTSSSRSNGLKWRSSKSKGSSSYTNITSPQSSIVSVRTPTLSDSCLEPRDIQEWLRDAKSGEPSNYRVLSEYPKEPLEDGLESTCGSRSGSCSLSPVIRTLTSQMRDGLTTCYNKHFDYPADNRSCAKQTRRSQRPVRSPGKIARTDLHTQSFLELSSSEDDNDGNLRSLKKPRRRSPKLNGHCCVSNVIRLGSETLTPPKQSRDVSKYIKARSSSLSYKAIEGALEECLRTSVVPRSSRLGHSVGPERSLLEDSLAFNSSIRRAGSPPAAGTSQRPFIRIPTELQLRTDRFMTVTREEKNLLEAMREKRASMRRAYLAEDRNNAIEQKDVGDSPGRPKTANADKRSSLSFKANISSFPAPPNLRSIKIFSRSSDAIRYEELSQFQEIPTVDDGPIQEEQNSSERFPNDSYRIQSDSPETLLSPPINQRSPYAPFPIESSTELPSFGDISLVSFPEPSLSGNKAGHHRKRPLAARCSFWTE